MTLKQRRILCSFFILLFLVISPLISLYAAGYKINFRTGQIQKTGTIIIKTKPRGAQVFLNGRRQKKDWQKFWLQENAVTTPAKISHLLPGQYTVELKKPGWWPWRQLINLQSGQSVNLDDILLFKKDVPWPFFYMPASRLYPAPNKKEALAVNKNGIFWLDFLNNNFKKISSATSAAPIIWAPEKEKAVIGQDLFDFSRPSGQKTKLNFYPPAVKPGPRAKIRHLRFAAGNNHLLTYLLNSSFYTLDLANGQRKKIISAVSVSDAILKDNYLAIVRNTGSQSFLDFYSLTGRNLLRTISLPFGRNYVFINPGHKFLNLYNPDRHSLYLINPHSLLPLKATIKDVKITAWQNGKLLYANDFEVWLYDPASGQKTIVTRLSQPLKVIFWHPEQKHVFFSTNKSIFIAELSQGHWQNINALVSFSAIQSAFFAPPNKIIFSGQIGAQSGVYKLEL